MNLSYYMILFEYKYIWRAHPLHALFLQIQTTADAIFRPKFRFSVTFLLLTHVRNVKEFRTSQPSILNPYLKLSRLFVVRWKKWRFVFHAHQHAIDVAGTSYGRLVFVETWLISSFRTYRRESLNSLFIAGRPSFVLLEMDDGSCICWFDSSSCLTSCCSHCHPAFLKHRTKPEMPNGRKDAESVRIPILDTKL